MWDAQQPVALEVTRRLDKLNRLLKSYQPDMIQLKGVFSKNQRTAEQSCALTLSLPNGTLHATGNGKNVLAGCKKAFSEIETQVKKHQSRLRREHEWKRKRRSNEALRQFCVRERRAATLRELFRTYAKVEAPACSR